MRVLVACEFSATVRDAFITCGHDAWSCDLLATDGDKRYHYQQDALQVAYYYNWDLMIAHPPCTYLCNSSARHLYNDDGSRNWERWEGLRLGAEFFCKLMKAPIQRICIENPIMMGHAKKLIEIKQSQIIQPWMFGHPEMRATCLWLKGLPALKPTDILDPPYEPAVHWAAPGPDRWKQRSKTLTGIANAMAKQWGNQ